MAEPLPNTNTKPPLVVLEEVKGTLVPEYLVHKKDAAMCAEPGDALLYNWKRSFFSVLIGIKTWHKISHCEMYVGDLHSIASRDGQGVGEYPFRLDQLGYILRPPEKFNFNKSYHWYETVKGQGYDWLGLLRFGWASGYDPLKGNNKQFCSEFLSRAYNKGDWYLFGNEDNDAIAPFMFLLAPFDKIIKVVE